MTLIPTCEYALGVILIDSGSNKRRKKMSTTMKRPLMKVLILYFSATGNTAKIAKVIEEKFKEGGVKVTMSDILP
jgi:flavorubredoxin